MRAWQQAGDDVRCAAADVQMLDRDAVLRSAILFASGGLQTGGKRNHRRGMCP